MKKKKSQKIKKNQKIKIGILIFFNLFFYLVTFFILVISLSFAITQSKNQSVFGFRALGVLSNSMVSPDGRLKDGGFRSGDIIIIKEISPKQIKIGDIITYHPSLRTSNQNTNYLTHRVAEVKSELNGEKGIFFITKGDANKTNDMPISEKQLVGKVVARIPKIGGIIKFIKENLIVSFIFVFSVLGFIWVIKTYILEEKRKPTTRKNVVKVHSKKKRRRTHKNDLSSSKEVK